MAPEELFNALLVSPIAPQDLPDGFAFHATSRGQTPQAAASALAIGLAVITLTGPDAAQGIGYTAFPTADDARGFYERVSAASGGTRTGGFTPQGLDYPTQCVEQTAQVSGQQVGQSMCYILLDNVIAQALSQQRSDTQRGNAETVTKLAHTAIRHYRVVRARGPQPTATPAPASPSPAPQAKPTAPPTATTRPPTPSPAPTLTAPPKIGQASTLTNQQGLRIVVTVHGVTDPAESSNQFNKPKGRWALVDWSVKNEGQSNFNVNLLSFKLQTTDGFLYDFGNHAGLREPQLQGSGSLGPGQTVRGYLAYDVASDHKLKSAVFQQFMGRQIVIADISE